MTSLPIAAACGSPVAKLAGHGLDTTGITVDKLESIPGLRCDLSEENFTKQLEEVGLAMMQQEISRQLTTRRSTPFATQPGP